MKIREFLKNIFSITDYNETHKVFRLLGLRIKFPKFEYYRLNHSNPYNYYKKNHIDIRTVPPANGRLRQLQLANLALLKEFDYVCSQNGLRYWLDFGTLLGAIRHKGFIPWDDDIDVSMMKEDYNKVIDAFKTSSRNPDIYAEFVYLGKSQAILKIRHKKCPHLFVDIFPREYSNNQYSNDDKIKVTNTLKKIRHGLSKNKDLNSSEKVIAEVNRIQSDLIENKYVEKSDVQYSLEYHYTEPIWVHSYEMIFPLKRIEFEGIMVSCINKPEKYLSDIFGEYMDYPKKFGFGHSVYADIPEDELNNLVCLGGAK